MPIKLNKVLNNNFEKVTKGVVGEVSHFQISESDLNDFAENKTSNHDLCNTSKSRKRENISIGLSKENMKSLKEVEER